MYTTMMVLVLAQGKSPLSALTSFAPLILIVVAFFWFTQRSEKKRRRQRQDMLNAIKTDGSPRVTLESSRGSLELALAMYKSADADSALVTLPL